MLLRSLPDERAGAVDGAGTPGGGWRTRRRSGSASMGCSPGRSARTPRPRRAMPASRTRPTIRRYRRMSWSCRWRGARSLATTGTGWRHSPTRRAATGPARHHVGRPPGPACTRPDVGRVVDARLTPAGPLPGPGDASTADRRLSVGVAGRRRPRPHPRAAGPPSRSSGTNARLATATSSAGPSLPSPAPTGVHAHLHPDGTRGCTTPTGAWTVVATSPPVGLGRWGFGRRTCTQRCGGPPCSLHAEACGRGARDASDGVGAIWGYAMLGMWA